MFTKLLVAVSLALCAAASPVTIRSAPISIPLARQFNLTGAKTVLELDQARARFLKHGSASKSKTRAKGAAATGAVTVPVTNGVVTYTVAVDVGSPATTYNLIVDTGSSNTWVGADFENPYFITSTSQDTGAEVFVEYGSGLFLGEEFLDTVSIGGVLNIAKQSIGAAEFAEGFDGVDGILGIGPTDLTSGTTSDGGLVPTVLDNAFSLGLISTKEIGISFAPTTNTSTVNGELIFGGVDTSKFTGELTNVPITTVSPASEFVGINQTITYGSADGTTVLASTAGIVDTGTTLLLLATDAVQTYQSLTGAVLDDVNTGLLQITPAQFANLQSLFFHIGDTTFEFTPNAQLWPRSLNTAIGGEADAIYLIVSDLGSPSGEGLDFINGFGWLERHFFVFNSANNTVSFATTQFTDATSN
ncbi:aspartic peptidase A1 [Phanerochaete sordida]|uniref:Aspartic peptidase A1 n=1 Tax=Phanerochaete sordida TaxID=48140 RepID=A0A9P3LJW5_9APHY|nr:aspartic peptidase A1 [Phanerochaete sordida]